MALPSFGVADFLTQKMGCRERSCQIDLLPNDASRKRQQGLELLLENYLSSAVSLSFSQEATQFLKALPDNQL